MFNGHTVVVLTLDASVRNEDGNWCSFFVGLAEVPIGRRLQQGETIKGVHGVKTRETKQAAIQTMEIILKIIKITSARAGDAVVTAFTPYEYFSNIVQRASVVKNSRHTTVIGNVRS